MRIIAVLAVESLATPGVFETNIPERTGHSRLLIQYTRAAR